MPNLNNNLHKNPLPLNRKNNMKIQIIITTTRITELIPEAVDLTEVSIMAESHIKGLSNREGDNRVITQANIKAIMDNLTPLMVAIAIITIAIINVEEALAMVLTIIDHRVMGEAINEAITIINTINIIHMMMDHSLSNMAHHAPFAEVSIIVLNIVLRMVYINKGDHEYPYGLPKDNLEGSPDEMHHTYIHTDIPPKVSEERKN